jgi:5,10-methylene-tetrahydrofolate dehydrogenase/methenyl tetrahydrofolate cyclohydrolase
VTHTAHELDGVAVAQRLRAAIAHDAAAFTTQAGRPPGLGFVLVGDSPASAQYVRMKRRACAEAGIATVAHILPEAAAQDAVFAAVDALNADPAVDGILVQLPLPAHIDEVAVLRRVLLEKDADGIHPVNLGLLAQKGRTPLFTPATPTGCMVLLREAGAAIAGSTAVVLGRSSIVGMPAALMLMREDATVTVCHSRTRDLPDILRRADIVIAAIGRPEWVKGSWLKPGAIVIDVGTNRIDDPADPRGYRFVGDVERASALPVVGALSRVPGGVGPLTITMLLDNTVTAAFRLLGTARPSASRE